MCSVRSAEACFTNQLVTRIGTTLPTSPSPSVGFEMKFPTVSVKQFRIVNRVPPSSTSVYGESRTVFTRICFFFSSCRGFVCCCDMKTAYILSVTRVFVLTRRRSSPTEVSLRRLPNDIRWRFTGFGTVKKPRDPPCVGKRGGTGKLPTE